MSFCILSSPLKARTMKKNPHTQESVKPPGIEDVPNRVEVSGELLGEDGFEYLAPPQGQKKHAVLEEMAQSVGRKQGRPPTRREDREAQANEAQMLPAAAFLLEENPYDLKALSLRRKLSKKIIQIVAEKVELGCNVRTVCDIELIDYQSLLRWRQRGEMLLSQLSPEKEDPVYENRADELCVGLVLALRKASGRYVGRLDYDIHFGENFSRALSIAERRNSVVYGKNAVNQQEEFFTDETFL